MASIYTFARNSQSVNIHMRNNLIVIDDFINNPIECRNYALNQQYQETGNYPGKRFQITETNPNYDAMIFDTFQAILGNKKIDTIMSYFQYTTSYDRSWIHADNEDYAAVLYLTPEAPISGGTGMFRHKETGIYSRLGLTPEQLDLVNSDSQDLTRWDKVAEIGNLFNRLVIYPGDLFHMGLDYFGKDLKTGRLFQVFFINLIEDLPRVNLSGEIQKVLKPARDEMAEDLI